MAREIDNYDPIIILGHYHLWSEVGGFIGIFLGFGLMQVRVKANYSYFRIFYYNKKLNIDNRYLFVNA